MQMIQECDEQREHCSKSAMMTMEPEFIIQTSPGTERTLQDSTQLQKAGDTVCDSVDVSPLIVIQKTTNCNMLQPRLSPIIV